MCGLINVNYHVVICPRYRKKNIPMSLFVWARSRARIPGILILSCSGDVDHIHLTINLVDVNLSIPKIMSKIKLCFGTFIRSYNPNFRFSGGYFCCSFGDMSSAILSDYLLHQKSEAKDDISR